MERRGFLQSLIAGVTSAGLIVKASPAEVEAFGLRRDDPVMLSPQLGVPAASPMAGLVLYDAQGQAVLMVTEVTYSRSLLEVDQVDSMRSYMPGLASFEIRGVGIGEPSLTWYREGAETRVRVGR